MIVQDLSADSDPLFQSPLDGFVQRLHDAVLASGADALTAVLRDMQAERIPAQTIAERCVPHVARSLGQDWARDLVDFSAVSIGVSRLQSILWQLRPEWGRGDLFGGRSDQAVLVVTPMGSQHTLGASVLAGTLRHRGISTDLELAADVPRMQALGAQCNYAAVMISASVGCSLELVANLVKTARAASPTTSILIGGNILDQMGDIKDIPGVDLATSDLDQAIDFCRLVGLAAHMPDQAQAG